MLTGIDKRPTDDPIGVRAPGPMHGGSGLVGDFIGDSQAHGGDDQAVYAYAREDLDVWQGHLERDLSNGMFGENVDDLRRLAEACWDLDDAVVMAKAWDDPHDIRRHARPTCCSSSCMVKTVNRNR